jgi:hypothetical protein
MKDIKELIYAAVEENALKFQELVNNQLQVRAYDAIESLRPEIGASMFGEAKKMEDDEEEMEDEDEGEDEDEDEKKSKVEEELKGNQHKIDKNKNGKIDGHDFKLLRKEVEEAINVFRKDPNPQGDTAGTPIRYPKGHSAHGDAHRTATAKAAKVARTQGHLRGNDNHHMGWKNSERIVSDKTGGVFAGRGPKPVRSEKKADVQEVAMPKNAADWQAMINHQIQIAGHPVATDAQFRATTVGKDMSKIASLEPGEDMLQYATAQGGTVKK